MCQMTAKLVSAAFVCLLELREQAYVGSETNTVVLRKKPMRNTKVGAGGKSSICINHCVGSQGFVASAISTRVY